jgi:hypothetical protein
VTLEVKYHDIRCGIGFKSSENPEQVALTSLQEAQNTTIWFRVASIHGTTIPTALN